MAIKTGECLIPKFWRGQSQVRRLKQQPPPPATNPTWANVRVSTPKQADDAQEHMRRIEGYCQNNGMAAPARKSIDIHSGYVGDCKHMLADIAAMEALPPERRPWRYLLVSVDRAGRNEAYFDELIEYLQYLNVKPIFIDQPWLDVFTPEGRQQAQQQMANAAYFSRNLKRNMPKATQRSFREGKKPGQPVAPYVPGGHYGKKSEGIPQLPDPEDPRWASKPDLVRQVVLFREAFERIARGANGETRESVFNDLKSRGLAVSRSQFFSSLRHPMLGGETWLTAPDWRGMRQLITDVRGKFVSVDGKRVRKKHDLTDWDGSQEQYDNCPTPLRIKGAWHEHAVVPMPLLLKANGMVDGERIAAAPRRARSPEYPLRGVIVCASCGKRLTAYTVRKKNGKRYAMYTGQPAARKTCPSCRAYSNVMVTDLQAMALLERVAHAFDGWDWRRQLRVLHDEGLADLRREHRAADADLRTAKQTVNDLWQERGKFKTDSARARWERDFDCAEQAVKTFEDRRSVLQSQLDAATGTEFDDLCAFVAEWLRNPDPSRLTLDERLALIRLFFPRGIPRSPEGVLTPVTASFVGLLPVSKLSRGKKSGLACCDDLISNIEQVPESPLLRVTSVIDSLRRFRDEVGNRPPSVTRHREPPAPVPKLAAAAR